MDLQDSRFFHVGRWELSSVPALYVRRSKSGKAILEDIFGITMVGINHEIVIGKKPATVESMM